uniref:Transmembrane protein 186 n=1 Tax=Hanusia phi TaxID=3032 RepID=A0A7S0I066_9CRYP|mmetsp:Transcript_736/g.1569  ORF Transcript_736/g.1569 Transcript_736/m.1569 type:complete len:210 (+) Transcript_736:45-674(+)
MQRSALLTLLLGGTSVSCFLLPPTSSPLAHHPSSLASSRSSPALHASPIALRPGHRAHKAAPSRTALQVAPLESIEETACTSSSSSISKKREEELQQLQRNSFIVGSSMIVTSAAVYYGSNHEAVAISSPLFKVGCAIFFLGVTLQYAETYNRCAYIRFARETLFNPSSLGRRARRVLRLVDGNIFRFLLPGRSYDVINGVPVQRNKDK